VCQSTSGDVTVYNLDVPSLPRDVFVFELHGDSVRVA
jgi:hypothetical protein